MIEPPGRGDGLVEPGYTNGAASEQALRPDHLPGDQEAARLIETHTVQSSARIPDPISRNRHCHCQIDADIDVQSGCVARAVLTAGLAVGWC